MQYLALIVLFLSSSFLSLQSTYASDSYLTIDRSPAIIGPATEFPVGEQAELYIEYFDKSYFPSFEPTSSSEQSLERHQEKSSSEAFHL